MNSTNAQSEEAGVEEVPLGPEPPVDVYEDLDITNSDDRLSYLVAMAFDNLAMSAGYGGIVPCPYPVDEDEGSISDGDFAGSTHSNDEVSSSASSVVGDKPRVTDVTEVEEHEDIQAVDNKSDMKRVRTAYGLDDVDIEMAGKPIAVASLIPEDEQILYTSEFLQVRKSDLGGFGMFAVKDLPYRQHILMERCLAHANYTSSVDQFNSLSAVDQKLFLDLHGHNPDDDTMEARVKATFFTNNFACDSHRGGAGVFIVASRFNHACYSRCNVRYGYDLRTDAMVFTVSKRGGVKAGEELTICYGKDRETLKKQYGFDCQCGACDSTLREYVDEQLGKVMERIQGAN